MLAGLDLSVADPHSNQPLGLNQLYPNLVVRDMVERWLQTGDAVADSGAAGTGSRLTYSHIQQLAKQLVDGQEASEDPLSSFGASSSSSSGSSTGSLV